MKFSAEESAISVMYSGTTEDLLAKIQAKAADAIKDENITGIEKGKINIKIK